MNKKAATLLLVGVVIAGGAFAYRDEAGSYTSRLLALVSSTAASEAAAQPGEMPVPQVPEALSTGVISARSQPSISRCLKWKKCPE